MEWITPGYDEYELSAEMTGYAGRWPAAGAVEAVEHDKDERDSDESEAD